MPSVDEMKIISQIGGWVFASVVLGSVIWALIAGKITAGGILDHLMGLYDKLVESHEKLTGAVDKTTDALALQAQAQAQLKEEVQRMDRAFQDGLRDIREEIRRSRPTTA